MHIQHLEIINLRNYDHLELSFTEPLTVFIGENAQGKTNLLESLYVGITGKSFRTNIDAELIRWNQDFGHIKLDFERGGLTHQSEVSILPNDKQYKLDQKKLIRRSELFGQLAMVLFTPDDLTLVKGDPSNRRRFLDFEISQTHPDYLFHLQRYQRVLKQRNLVFKEVYSGQSSRDMIYIWDTQLIEHGAQLMFLRQQTLAQLNSHIQEFYPALNKLDEPIRLEYKPSFEMNATMPVTDIQSGFREHLAAKRDLEFSKGTTIAGPHRDDFDIFLGDRDLKAYGSQGQQRSGVLALKFSEIYYIKEVTGEYPIVALDDFMSELDDRHIDFLLKSLPVGMQIFITSIHPLPELFSQSPVKYYRVVGGKLQNNQ